MPSAALPPELQQIARDAARNGRRPAPPRTATILGLGHYLPTEIVPNGHIAERIGVDDHWIVKRTGIHARRRAAANEGTTDLAVFAARRALQDAGIDAARSRLRDRRDDERGRDHAQLRAARRPRDRRRARRRVRHRRRLHRLPRRARAGRRDDRGRPRGARSC